MALTIAKLSTISTLDNTQFSRGLTKMRTDIGAFSAISFGAFNRIGGLITDFGRRALSALPRMVTSSLAAGDALADLSTQLGFSTETLVNLQRVAGLAGIELGGLETAIGKMNQTLGEAVGGNREAAKAFDDLGLSFSDLEKRSPEDTFFAVLDAIKQIPSVARRSAAAVDLFGRSGRSMLRLLDMGSVGIRAEAVNTRRLGLVSSQGDLAGMARASDTLDDLKNNLRGFSDQLAKNLTPLINTIGQEFLGFSKQTNLAAKAAESVATEFRAVSLLVADFFDKFTERFPFTASVAKEVNEGTFWRNNFPFATSVVDMFTGGGPTDGMGPAGPRRAALERAFSAPNQRTRPPAIIDPDAARRERQRQYREMMDQPTPMTQWRNDRVEFWRSEERRMQQVNNPSRAQEQYLKEIRDELRKLNAKPASGGVRP